MTAGLDEATNYDSSVKEAGKGHGLGSPHTHIFLAMVTCLADPDTWEEIVEDKRTTLGTEVPSSFFNRFLDGMNEEKWSQKKVGELARYFRVTKR